MDRERERERERERKRERKREGKKERERERKREREKDSAVSVLSLGSSRGIGPFRLINKCLIKVQRERTEIRLIFPVMAPIRHAVKAPSANVLVDPAGATPPASERRACQKKEEEKKKERRGTG